MGGFKDPEKQKEIVKANFLKYTNQLGHTPSYNELRKTPKGFKYLSSSSIERNFGSFRSLINELGLKGCEHPNQYSEGTLFTDSQILECIQTICGETGRFDCTFYHKRREKWMPGLKAIKLHFGTWRQTLSRMNLGQMNHVLGRKLVIANDGHICDSAQESRVDDCLFEHNIRHIVHRQYPESRMIMDFFLPDTSTVIEYAGLWDVTGIINKKTQYREKIRKKEKIAEKKGWRFILIKPVDLQNVDYFIDAIQNQ